MVSISLPDAAATRALGARIAAACRPGNLILLTGPLGAGKTTLVDGFAAGLGAGRATSPSFVIAHFYPGGRIPIWHVDLYRLDDGVAVADLDLAQYLSAETVTICEWPERAGDVWPPDFLKVELALHGPARRATISAVEPASTELARMIREEGSSLNA